MYQNKRNLAIIGSQMPLNLFPLSDMVLDLMKMESAAEIRNYHPFKNHQHSGELTKHIPPIDE